MYADTLILFDLDRTLCDTERVSGYILRQLETEFPEVAPQVQRELTVNRGKRFDLFRYLEQQLGEEGVKRFLTTVATSSPYDSSHYFISGGQKVLADLAARSVAIGVLTYGNQIYQVMKLKLMGMATFPCEVTSVPGQKANVIASWWNEESSRFVVPTTLGGGVYRSVILIDDKIDELLPVHSNVTTLLYQPDGVGDSQIGISGVITELRQVAAYL